MQIWLWCILLLSSSLLLSGHPKYLDDKQQLKNPRARILDKNTQHHRDREFLKRTASLHRSQYDSEYERIESPKMVRRSCLRGYIDPSIAGADPALDNHNDEDTLRAMSPIEIDLTVRLDDALDEVVAAFHDFMTLIFSEPAPEINDSEDDTIEPKNHDAHNRTNKLFKKRQRALKILSSGKRIWHRKTPNITYFKRFSTIAKIVQHSKE